jgi:DNA primase
MKIPESFIDELIARTDIEELVGRYVRFSKRSGSNSFALCPFHSEKTASFSVNSEKQIYYCFGCGKGGGPINFIMEIENLPFTETIEFLAKIAGMTVPESGVSDDFREKRRRMLELNRDAARFFHDMLYAPRSERVRDYLKKRGISKNIATRFGLGFAVDSWSNLIDSMTAKGYSIQELLDAGLARKGKEGKGAYDYFRNRLIFPIIDIRGDVIGFSGRIVGDGEPKYLNSPDTMVYNKSRSLFALNLAKKSKSGMLILAEGNIDVVALHQAGFDCAVASLGTALTADQIRLMSRYTEKIVLAYDSDQSGQKATMRAISLIEKTGMKVSVLNFGDSQDPDEYLKKHGADAFKLLIERSENHIEYRLLTVKSNSDLSSNDGRIAYIEAATQIVSELYSKPEREIYSSQIAEIAGVSLGAIQSEVDKAVKAKRIRQKKQFEKNVINPKNAIQPVDKSLRYENEYSAAAEEGVIRCIMKDPTLLQTANELGFSIEEFTSPFLAKLYSKIATRANDNREMSAAHIMTEFFGSEASQFTAIMQKPEVAFGNRENMKEYIGKIRAEKYKTDVPSEELLREIRKYKETK